MVLDKNALLMRDTKGELIPLEIESIILKGTIKIQPLTQGDFNEIAAKTNDGTLKDEDILCKYVKEPILTPEDIKQMPLISKSEIVKLILMSSGMTREETEVAIKKGTQLMDERLKKNLKSSQTPTEE